MPSPEQLKAWAESYLKGTISESDKKALEDWYASQPGGEVEWNGENDSAEALKSRLFDVIDRRIGEDGSKVRRIGEDGSKVRRIGEDGHGVHRFREDRSGGRRIGWRSFAAAAAVLVLVVPGYVLLRQRSSQGRPEEAVVRMQKDIQPGRTRATLMLADGKKMPVDSQHLLNVTSRKGAVYVLDKDGSLSYAGSVPSPDVYNVLETHKGEQSPPLILPDGTKVWLNAASSLRFPVAFNGRERKVMLAGEAYFEVARNISHPFVVGTAGDKVEVLGTHFNVKAYDDEPFTYVTLLEGAIKVSNDRRSVTLSPGQQSKTNAKGDLRVDNVDTDQSIAWMNGLMPLNSMDVKSFLREVSRWYDVAVVYEGEPPVLSFSGSLNRDVPISQVMAALNANGIHCMLKDKTVIITGK